MWASGIYLKSHCEELKLLSEMSARKRTEQEQAERDAKVYEDYDWTDLLKKANCKSSGKVHGLP